MKSFDLFTLNTIMDPLVYTIIICCLSAPHLPFTARLMILGHFSLVSWHSAWLHQWRPLETQRRGRRQKYVVSPMDSFLWHLEGGFQWVLSLGNLTGLCHTFNQSLLYAISSVELCTLHYNLSKCQTVHYQDISSLRTGSTCLSPLFYSAHYCSRQQQ